MTARGLKHRLEALERAADRKAAAQGQDTADVLAITRAWDAEDDGCATGDDPDHPAILAAKAALIAIKARVRDEERKATALDAQDEADMRAVLAAWYDNPALDGFPGRVDRYTRAATAAVAAIKARVRAEARCPICHRVKSAVEVHECRT